MWPSTRLSSAATAASASPTGSPASAARSSMASSSSATAAAVPARTGTPQRSANSSAIPDLPPLGARPVYGRSSSAWCASGLLQDEHVAIGIADDGLGGPWLLLRRAVELDARGGQPLVFGVEVVAGQHQPAQ